MGNCTGITCLEKTKSESKQQAIPIYGYGDKSNTRTIQLLNTVKSPAGLSFLGELRDKIEQEMTKVKGITDEVEAAEESGEDNVLIVIVEKCASSMESLDKCLKHVKNDRYGRFIVIVLHVMREDQLPRTCTDTAQLLFTDCPDDYHDINTILDIGYLPDKNKGIYHCRRNKTALQEIDRILKLNLSIPDQSQMKRRKIEQGDDEHPSIRKDREPSRHDAYLLTSPNKADAVKEFEDKFKKAIGEHGVSLQTIESLDTNELNPNIPILLVCNNSSRIEADLHNCLYDISSKNYDRILLVVLHVCRREKLPTTYTRNYLRSCSCDEKYKTIPKIIDVAYIKESGIYSCKMNEDAFKELEDFQIYQQLPDVEDKEVQQYEVHS